MNYKNRQILAGCIVASLVLHLMALLFFERYNMWFASAPIAKECDWLDQVEKKEKDQILKTAFASSENSVEEGNGITVKIEPEKIAPLIFRSTVQPVDFEISHLTHFQMPFPMENLLASNQERPHFSLPSSTLDLLDYLPKELIIPVSEKKHSSFPALPMKSSLQFLSQAPPIETKAPSVTPTFSENLEIPNLSSTKNLKAAPIFPTLNLPSLPTLEELDTSSLSDSFDTDLVFLEGDEGKYIFALTLIPKPSLKLPKLKQHFTFLIDKANSVQQERLTATKAAVRKALEEMSPDDTFNIIAFDNKIEKLAPHSLPCTKQTRLQASEFLEGIHLGSFFSASEISKPLFLTVPSRVENNETHTAILFTDSESLSKKQSQRSILSDWTHYNDGKVGLFVVALDEDANPSILETATAFNKGKLLSSPTNRGLKRKLQKLMKNIHDPIAKNMSCVAIHRSEKGNICFFPTSMPNLYEDQPFVILGETSSLDDFILFVQGRMKERWLNVKKKISFVNGRKASKSLKQEWAFQRVYNLYQSYIMEEDPKYLVEAKSLLEPFDMQVSFK